MEPVNLAPAVRATSAAKQYLSFSLGDEEYAVDILRVREIRGICPITPLPQSPAMLKGVMNLRGAVVPVVDLRIALGLPPSEYGKFTVIIVMALNERTVGFVVDSVIGEHQTVIKSLGRMYRDVQGVSGATILGDGTVALILDMGMLLAAAEQDELH